jgi:hypothetical protein
MPHALVFPNGRMITGTRTKDDLRKLIEQNGAAEQRLLGVLEDA